MKRFLQKTAFAMSVLCLWMIFMAAALMATEILLPVRRGPDGLYRGGDRMGLSVVAFGVSSWTANWVVSSLFQWTGISRERWSLFRSPRSWE
jgi:hypothetical protein